MAELPAINTSPLIFLTKGGFSSRRCAATLGVSSRGTLGIIITAKQRGVILAARPVLEQLCLCGMYLSNRIINQALALVGE